MSGDAGTERVVRRGRPTGDHAARRAELLKAAASVIAQEGYANASLRKVAQRAGCTTGAVTYYFANKEELVAALAESRFDTYDAMLDAVRDRVDVKALFEQWLARTADDPDFWPVMSQLLAHARYEAGLRRLHRTALRTLPQRVHLASRERAGAGHGSRRHPRRSARGPARGDG